jgi:hypothetical protein
VCAIEAAGAAVMAARRGLRGAEVPLVQAATVTRPRVRLASGELPAVQTNGTARRPVFAIFNMLVPSFRLLVAGTDHDDAGHHPDTREFLSHLASSFLGQA